jgi:hypothetical protein
VLALPSADQERAAWLRHCGVKKLPAISLSRPRAVRRIALRSIRATLAALAFIQTYMPFSLLLRGSAVGRVGRYLAALAAYSVLLAILGKSAAYLLSWLFVPVVLLFLFPVQLAIGSRMRFEYILVLEALVFFAIAFAIDVRAPNVGKWFARLGLVLCFALITLLMSESGVGR